MGEMVSKRASERGEGGRSAFYRLGGFAVRRRRVILGIWLLTFAAATPFLGKLSTRLSQGGFEVAGSQSDQVKRALETQFKGQFEFKDLLVLNSPSLTANQPRFRG